MSTLEVNTIKPISGSSTVTLGESGDTIALASGASQTLAAMTPAFAAKMSGTQQLANDTSTKIAYDTEVYDTDSAYDHSSNYRFTVPSGKAGKYFIGASIRSGNMADTKKITMNLFVNGSEVAEHYAQVASSNSGEQYTIGVFKTFDLSASDYIEVFVLHQNGAAVNFSSSSSIGSYFYGYRLIGA
jgi:hypothetical protein